METYTTPDSLDYLNPRKEEEPEHGGHLYCFFDNPVPMAMEDQARQTLPPDFGLGRSDIPAGTIPFGVHFGPCEGDLVCKEESITNVISWMLYNNATVETYTAPDTMAYLNPEQMEEPADRGGFCGGTSNPIGSINFDDHQSSVFQSEPVNEEFLYCEICRSYFTNMCEVHGPALFIFDTPVPMGTDDRARQTLPPGLELGMSGAGLGVFNNREAIPPGAHFGPYVGDLVDKEEAMNSGYSWVIFKSGQCEQYIDAKREMYSNWMKYVNCARHESEQNLVAIQYLGSIFFRCCQPIEPGQELLMWYEDDYGKDLGTQFDYLWKNKCSSNETNDAFLQTFSCSSCPLSYTSQLYCINHMRRSHSNQHVKQLLSTAINETLMPTGSSSRQQTCSGTSTYPTHGQDDNKFYHSDYMMSFTDPDDCKTQQCIHTSENPCPCSKNEEDIHQKDDAQQSQSNLREKKKHFCIQCGKNFNNGRNYRQHYRIHTGEKPYGCSQCGKHFRQQTHLRTHQRIHTGEKPYHCTECGKSFNNGSNYRQHLRTHTGEKPYHCSVCGKNFTSQSHLNDHERIHTGEKPYQCQHCQKVFNKSSSLNRHQLIHTGTKPYHCSKCGQRFMYSVTFKRHKCSMTQPSDV